MKRVIVFINKISKKPQVELVTTELKNAYTILHKLVFNIKKIFAKVPGLRTKVGTYDARTLFTQGYIQGVS